MRAAVLLTATLTWCACAYGHAPREGGSPGAGLEVQRHEVLSSLQAAPAATDDGAVLQFDALGRRFELELAPNERLARHLVGHDTAVYRGRLRGRPDSWVRLTRHGNRYSGLFSDGDELLAIDSGRALGLTEEDVPVLFRLADTWLDAEASGCAARPAGRRVPGSAAVAGLSAELSRLTSAHTAGTDGTLYHITLSVVADPAFASHHDATVDHAIVSRLNVVDGLYEEQIGLLVELEYTEVPDQDPFDTDDSGELLERFGEYRASTHHRNSGLSHLLTGRRLTSPDSDATVIGSAYLGRPCDAQWASGISRAVGSVLRDALVIAHEIGHNFGAPHDGESGEATDVCPDEEQIYLMAPRLDPAHSDTWDRFSACSREVITQVMLGASCVSTVASQPVQTPPPGDAGGDTSATPGPSGGGGTLGPSTLLALAALGLWRLRRRSARAGRHPRAPGPVGLLHACRTVVAGADTGRARRAG